MRCRQQNLHSQHYAQLHLDVLSSPVHFIVMDLIDKFTLLPQGHYSALTVIDMLTNYMWFIPLCTKEADRVVHAYLAYVYSMFDGLHRILSETGTEFMNKLFMQIASTLGMKQMLRSHYLPGVSGCIENVHNILKTCI